MRNYWLKDKIVAKGVSFWTFEIFDLKQKSIVSETIVEIDECPSMKILESLEVDGKWTPVLIIWEQFEATYTDRKFLECHDHIRIIEVDGNSAGILRRYDESGNHTESWVMHGLEVKYLDFNEKKAKVTFTFHHAIYLADAYEN